MDSCEDKVWFDRDRKIDGLCRDIIDAKTGQSNVIVLAHFKSTLGLVERILRNQKIEYKSYLPLDSSSLCSGSDVPGYGKVWLGLASYFQARSLPAQEKTESHLRILVAEHHPLASKDRVLVEVTNSLLCKTQMIFHSSLDDPFLSHFGADRMRGLMQQLGMEKQDCISHPLISTAIKTAQEKIESQIHREVQTLSPEDWFKYNLVERR